MEYNIKKIIIGSRESKLAKAHVEIFKRKFNDKFKKNLDIKLITKFKTASDTRAIFDTPTRMDPDGPGWTRTGLDKPKQTQMDPDGPLCLGPHRK